MLRVFRSFCSRASAAATSAAAWCMARLGTRRSAAMLGALVLLGVFALGRGVGAEDAGSFFSADKIAGVFAEFLLQPIINFLGGLLLDVVNGVITIGQYNGFTDAVPVVKGWVIVRDVTNMFYIVILLYIAFKTMFGEGGWEKQVLALLISAVVINFSRTICGLAIDLSQVVMLTFINGVKDAAGGNFVELFQIREMMQPTFAGGAVGAGEIISLHLLAIVMLLTSLVTTIVLLVFLAIRIIYLWILVIFSPLALFLQHSPIGQGEFGKWKGMFTQQLMAGPVLAFFLWLALITTQATNGEILSNPAAQTQGGELPVVPSFLGGSVRVQSFIIGNVMLMLAVKFASAVGGSTFGMANSLVNKHLVNPAKKYAVRLGKGSANLAVGGLNLATQKITKSISPSGQGYTLQDIGSIAKQKVLDTKAAKVLGFNADYNKNKAAEDEIASLRNRGDKDAAKKKEEEYRGRLADQQLRKKSPDQLLDMLNDPKQLKGMSQYEKDAAFLAIAKKGHSSLKGKGAEITDLAKAMGVTESGEAAARQALKEKGDANAFVGFDEEAKERKAGFKFESDIKNKMEDISPQDLSAMLKGISKGVVRGPDGKFVDAHAKEKLLSINEDIFTGFDRKKQKDVINETFKALDMLERQTDPADTATLDAIKTKRQQLLEVYDPADRARAETKAKEAGEKALERGKKSLASQQVGAVKKNGQIHHGFRAFEAGTGMVGAEAGGDALRAYMNTASGENASKLAQNLDSSLIESNDGLNDAALGLMANMDAKKLQEVAKAGKSDQLYSLVAAARNMQSRLGDSDKQAEELNRMVDEYQARVASLKHTEGKDKGKQKYDQSTIDSMAHSYRLALDEAMTKAAAQAKEVVNAYDNRKEKGNEEMAEAMKNVKTKARRVLETAGNVLKDTATVAAVAGGGAAALGGAVYFAAPIAAALKAAAIAVGSAAAGNAGAVAAGGAGATAAGAGAGAVRNAGGIRSAWKKAKRALGSTS